MANLVVKVIDSQTRRALNIYDDVVSDTNVKRRAVSLCDSLPLSDKITGYLGIILPTEEDKYYYLMSPLSFTDTAFEMRYTFWRYDHTIHSIYSNMNNYTYKRNKCPYKVENFMIIWLIYDKKIVYEPNLS